jgi:putative SOS response-associated peptidase YedK
VAPGRSPAGYFWFGLAGDEPRPPFAFAGLWRDFQPGPSEGESRETTHTIITTTANDVVRPVHPDRMPVILDPADYERWLTGSADEANALLRPFPAERMRIVAEGVGLRSDAGAET